MDMMIEGDLESLMQEPPHGLNYGRTASADPMEDGRWLPLSVEDTQAREFLQHRGWNIVDVETGGGSTGYVEAGMTVHRGVVHPDEYIDWERVRCLVEDNLGCPLAEIEEVYRAGKPTALRARTRAVIDARLLALFRAGGNMLELARILCWAIDEKRSDCRMMRRALERARAAEAVASP